MNQSPGGATKIQIFDDAVFAVKVSKLGTGTATTTNLAKTIRTHPPKGIPGVDSITYFGAHPMAKLSVTDSDLNAAGVQAEMYGYSAYRPGMYVNVCKV